MKFETEAGTDIAMIGIWDAGIPPTEISSRKLMDNLDRDGRDRKLLRIDTGADGSYTLCVVSTPEEFDAFPLEAYTKVEHDFFLTSESGTFVAGGIEDYRNGDSQITSDKDCFQLESGSYRVHVYVYNEDEELFLKQLKTAVGEDDVEHYHKRKSGCAPAGGLAVAGIVLGFIWTWWVLFPALLLAAGVLRHFSQLSSRDERIQRVEQAIRSIENSTPMLLFRFEAVAEPGVSNGAFHLDEVLNA